MGLLCTLHAVSDDTLEEGEPYESLAEHMNSNKSMVATMIQPAADAARLIVDAVLDDDGPMRYGCDPMSAGMIDAWRQGSDEDMMRGMLQHLVPQSAGGD